MRRTTTRRRGPTPARWCCSTARDGTVIRKYSDAAGAATDHLGYSVTVPGDLSGDGEADVVAGVPDGDEIKRIGSGTGGDLRSRRGLRRGRGGDRRRGLRRRVGPADAGEGRDLQQRGRRLRPPGGRGRRRGRGGGLRGLRRRQPAAAAGCGRALQRDRRRLRRDGRRRQRRRRRRHHDALRLQRRRQRCEAGGGGDLRQPRPELRRTGGRVVTGCDDVLPHDRSGGRRDRTSSAARWRSSAT